MIGFNIPIYIEGSLDCIKEAIKSRKICGDGEFTKKCSHGKILKPGRMERWSKSDCRARPARSSI